MNGLTCTYGQLYVVEAQQLIAVVAPHWGRTDAATPQ
jgi:hypothetical protein